jgi:hypothetical protein
VSGCHAEFDVKPAGTTLYPDGVSLSGTLVIEEPVCADASGAGIAIDGEYFVAAR